MIVVILVPELLPNDGHDSAAEGLRVGAEVYLEVDLLAHPALKRMVMLQRDNVQGKMADLWSDFLVAEFSFTPDFDSFTG